MTASSFIHIERKHTSAITWSVTQGTVQIFIIGPGPDAWLACSKPNYHRTSPGCTRKEMAIAKAAVVILNQRHREDKDAGVPHIRQALKEAARQVRQEAQQARLIKAWPQLHPATA